MNQPSIQVTSELRQAIGNAEVTVAAFRQAGLNERADRLEDCIINARKLRFSVGVVAQAKRGKSTLINGLLGRSDDLLAPIDRFPATNVVSCFANGPKQDVRVLFQSDPQDAAGKKIAIEEIRDYACEEHNPDNQKGVRMIEVIGTFPRLGQDVVLVDTPGADNALTKVHDTILFECLPKLDAVIFLVTADAPLVAAELDLLKQIRKNDTRKLIFAMNKADSVDGDELQEGLRHNRRVLADAGFADAPLFSISAKTFHATGADAGTESLMQELGTILADGRAGVIAERLAAITATHVEEAEAEIKFNLESAEMTIEEIAERQTKLAEMKRSLGSTRKKAEEKFHKAWIEAFDQVEGALLPIQRQMVEDYSELIEKTPASELNEVSAMIHTDVIKRLDELVQPHADRLSKALTEATRGLQVDMLESTGLTAREASALVTPKQAFSDTLKIVLAGAPSLAGALIVGTLPGLVGSAILSTAPAIATIAWNPLTWIPAVTTGAAAAAVSTTAAAVTAALTPIALVGAPLLVGYAGLRVISAWKTNTGRTKNELSMAVKDLITGAIQETRDNLRRAKASDAGMLEEFRQLIDSQIDEEIHQLEVLQSDRPSPERIAELRQATKIVERLRLPAPRSASGTDEAPPEHREPLFP